MAEIPITADLLVALQVIDACQAAADAIAIQIRPEGQYLDQVLLTPQGVELQYQYGNGDTGEYYRFPVAEFFAPNFVAQVQAKRAEEKRQAQQSATDCEEQQAWEAYQRLKVRFAAREVAAK